MRGSGGMYDAPTREQVITGEFGCLTNCLLQSRKGGYIYFEANALQAMAELLNFRRNRELLENIVLEYFDWSMKMICLLTVCLYIMPDRL